MPQSRHDSQHLIVEALAAAIESGDGVPKDVQVLIKCHPFDDPACYVRAMERFSNVRMFSTAKRPDEPATNWLPDTEEIENARDCFVFADVTCNIYSTVTIEAALFDKPIIHIAFDAAPLPPGRVPCREYYNFTHFKPIVDMEASTLVYSQEEFHRALRDALESPGAQSTQRRALATRFAGPMDGRSSQRVVRELFDLLSIAEISPAEKQQVTA
jgi:CDP-glycerol glycerophosphotransferase (TagB/SpsB family)